MNILVAQIVLSVLALAAIVGAGIFCIRRSKKEHREQKQLNARVQGV